MPMIVSKKQRIFFAVEGERGPMLMLHHGLFGSHRDWYDWGFVATLQQDYRLILPDARGHGRSDKPLEPAQYRLELLAEDVVALLDDLDVRNIFYLGYSLGALVGLELATRFPRRVRGAVLGGESPFVSGETVADWEALAEKLAGQSIAAVAEELVAAQRIARGQGALSDDVAESPPARAMLEAMAGWERNDAGRITVRTPLALFEGEREEARPVARKAHEALSQAKLIIVPGKTTVQALQEREPLLKEAVAFFRASRRGQEGGPDRERGRHTPPERDRPAEPAPADGPPPATPPGAQPAQAAPPHPPSAVAAPPPPDPAGAMGGAEPAGEMGDDDAYEQEAVAYGEADDDEEDGLADEEGLEAEMEEAREAAEREGMEEPSPSAEEDGVDEGEDRDPRSGRET